MQHNGSTGNDTLQGNDGDTLIGNTGSDTYQYQIGDGNITINNTGNQSGDADVLEFLAGISPEDVSVSQFPSFPGILELTIDNGDGTSSVITVSGFSSFINSELTDELSQIQFADGTVWDSREIKDRALIGAGTDEGNAIYAYSTDTEDNVGVNSVYNAGYGGYGSSINALGGNDLVYGGSGNDIIDGGDGDDTIAGFEGDDFVTDLSGDNIILGYQGEDILFAGSGNDTLLGGQDNDFVISGDGDDDIYGGTGDDWLIGGSDNDTYNYSLGDGNDLITNNSYTNTDYDILKFGEGITQSDITFYREPHSNDVAITINGSATIILEDALAYTEGEGYTNRLQEIQFADGSSWNETEIHNRVLGASDGDDVIFAIESGPNSIDGLDGDDIILGGDLADLLLGNNGDDTINGGAGDDVISGDSGNDSIQGSSGNDGLFGGQGDDTIDPGTGNDYIFASGGNDHLQFTGDFGLVSVNSHDYIGANNTAAFIGVNFNELWFSQNGDDLLATVIGTSNQVTIRNWFLSDEYKLDHIEADDGILLTSGIQSQVDITNAAGISVELITQPDASSQIPGSVTSVLAAAITTSLTDSTDVNLAQTLTGSANADDINGFGGDDTISALDGDDTINGGEGADSLHADGGDDIILGGADNDMLMGGQGHDFLNGEAGDDYLNGGHGNDTYFFSGDIGQDRIWNNGGSVETVDVIRFEDLSLSDLWFSQSGNDLLITVANSTDQVTIVNWYVDAQYQLDQIEVGIDAQVIFEADIQTLVDAMASELAANGLTVTDIASGGIPATVTANLQSTLDSVWQSENTLDGADQLEGTAGNDTISGFGGNDELRGLDGDDVLNGGTGNDILFADNGNDELNGGDGHDALYGGWGNDTFVGGAGDDYFYGDIGEDLYIFSGDFGSDRINNNDWAGTADTVRFDGYTQHDLWFTQNGNDLQMTALNNGVATDNSVTLRNWFNQDLNGQKLEEIQASGSVLDQQSVEALVQAMATISTSGVPADLNNLSAEQQTALDTAIADAWT